METNKAQKPEYIEHQENNNCQQFFGPVSNCVFAMPGSHVGMPHQEKVTPDQEENEDDASENEPDDKVAAAIKAVHKENVCRPADWAVIVRILEEKKMIRKSAFLADARFINKTCGIDVTNEDSLARSSIFTKVAGLYPYWRIKDGEETRETDGLLRKYKAIGEIFVKALGE